MQKIILNRSLGRQTATAACGERERVLSLPNLKVILDDFRMNKWGCFSSQDTTTLLQRTVLGWHMALLMFSCTASMCFFKFPFCDAAYPHSPQTWLLIFSCTASMCIFNLLFCEAAYPHSPQTWLLMLSCTASMCCFKWCFCLAAYPHSVQTWLFLFSCTASMCLFKSLLYEAAYPHSLASSTRST